MLGPISSRRPASLSTRVLVGAAAYNHSLRIATECEKHASAEVEEEHEGGSWDPNCSERFEGVFSGDLIGVYAFRGLN